MRVYEKIASIGLTPLDDEETILAAAKVAGGELTHRQVTACRMVALHDAARAERCRLIKRFVYMAGGSKVTAMRLGVSRNTIKLAKSRGRLPPKHRDAIEALARDVGFDLRGYLFELIS